MHYFYQYQLVVDESIVNIYVDADETDIVQLLEESKKRGGIELRGKYSADIHQAHTSLNQKHIQIMRGKRNCAQ